MLKTFRSFLADKTGNFGILTALILTPLVGAAGMALDFGRALELKSQLEGAADAAALGAISEKSKAAAEAAKLSGDGAVTLKEDEARKLFFGQLTGLSASDDVMTSSLPIDVDIRLVKENGVVSSQVVFSATLSTTFMRILGKESIGVSGTATASYQMPSYLDFYMLLDNTPSMGVGATPADVAKLRAATKNAAKDADCAFACHIVSADGVEDTTSYYYLAKSIGATIRIDVVADAVSALMKTAKETQILTGQFRIGAYTFGKAAADAGLFTVANPTIDLDAVSKATKLIELMSIPSHSYPNGQTDFNAALTGMGQKITAVGNGTSAAARQPIVFLVADGVGDAYRSNCQKKLSTSKGNRCMEPLDVQYCSNLKARGIKIAVLYTTYLPLPEDSFYNSWIKPFQGEIPSNMQACASDGYYFEVSPTQGISEAMDVLFRKIVGRLRLTS